MDFVTGQCSGLDNVTNLRRPWMLVGLSLREIEANITRRAHVTANYDSAGLLSIRKAGANSERHC
jgi:hypothetical protein